MAETIIIIQAVTIIITSGLAILNFFIGNLRAKNESAKTMTGFRHTRWQALLKVSGDIGAKIFRIEHTEDSKKKEILEELAADVNELGYILNGTWEVDKDIIKLARNLLSQATEYVKNGTGLSALQNSHNQFYSEVSIYSAAEWARIKNQSKGKGAEFRDWDADYKKIRAEYEKSVSENKNQQGKQK